MADQSLAFLTKMGLAAAPAGQPIGLPAAPVQADAPPVGLGKTEVTFAPPAQAAAPPAVVQVAPVAAAPAPWMPPAAAQAAPVAAPAPAPAPFVAPAAASFSGHVAPVTTGTVTQGYGSQINPPESALPVAAAAPVVAVAAVDVPAVTPAVTPETPTAPKKGPGRPKKEKGVDGSVSTATCPDAAEPSAVNVFGGEQISLHDRALIAVLPSAFEACKAAIFAGTAAPSSALELARAVVAPLKEEAGK